jgi:hypothetical protein
MDADLSELYVRCNEQLGELLSQQSFLERRLAAAVTAREEALAVLRGIAHWDKGAAGDEARLFLRSSNHPTGETADGR